jgi:hypothetical protein
MNINKKHVDRQTPECRSLAERLQTVARRRRREVDRHAGCMQVACSRSVTAALLSSTINNGTELRDLADEAEPPGGLRGSRSALTAISANLSFLVLRREC